MAWREGRNHDRAVLKLLTSAFSRKDRIIECVLSYIGCGGLGEIQDMMVVMEEEELLPFYLKRLRKIGIINNSILL